MTTFNLTQNFKIVPLLKPAADAAGRSSGFITLKNTYKAYVICYVAQGNLAPVTFSLQQATKVSGVGAKALSGNARIWYLDNADTGDTLVQQASATSFTTSAALTSKMVVFELVPAEILDITNGYRSINVSTNASSASNVTSALAEIGPLFFAQATPASALVD